MQPLEDLGSGFAEVTTYRGFYTHEQDLENILSSGREWYGEPMITGSNLSVDLGMLPNLTTTGQLQLILATLNRDQEQAQIQVSLNSQSLGSLNIDAIDTDTYDPKGVQGLDTLYLNQNQLTPGSLSLQLDFQAGAGGRGNLNFAVVTYEAALSFDNGALAFASPLSLTQNQTTYRITTALNNPIVWDISDPQNVAIQEHGIDNGDVVFGAESAELHSYIILGRCRICSA